MQKLFLALIFFIPGLLRAQLVEIRDSSGVPILYFENDRLVEAGNKKVLLTVKGNTVFDGVSEEKEDILLLVTAEDIFVKRKEGYALNAKQDDALFSILNGGFYLGAQKVRMAYYKKEEGGGLTLYGGSADSILCGVSSSLSTGKLTALFYYFMRRYNLDQAVKDIQMAAVKPPQKEVTSTSGTISRLWNTGVDEFTWDGSVFKRKWNSWDFEEWTFDGITLKRLWYPGDEEFVWDGQVLRRKWYPSNDEFEWNGTILRRRYGSSADEFIIQGNIVKRYFGGNSEDEWQINGEVPIPLIALVVFGLLRR